MPNVPEDMRHTVQVKLRIQPEVAEKLDAGCEKTGKGRSEWISELINAAARRLGIKLSPRVG